MFKVKKHRQKRETAPLGLAAFLCLAMGCATASADSMFGLPGSAAGTSEIVGSLPNSTQWISEKTSSYLYLGYNSSQMAASSLSVGQYSADFKTAGYAYPSIDFFSRLGSFASPESRSAMRDFSLWGRYSLGFADRDATLSASDGSVTSSVEKDSLLIFSARVSLLLGYEKLSWFKPYAGMEIDPYFFRNASGISGAEEQGENLSYGPVLGAHFPVLFSGRASLLAEYRRMIPVSGSGQIFTSSNNFTAGMGLAF